ncbi:ricin-type beta-trefoil lectin domain protein [Streptomyces sp. NPDC086549]|uniref:ricin-type beta-trefoil lectin domain protein n=1 Tax=Streptomyces sp. NPDC086549 TaxID=3365752 RepID=UPI00381AD7F9
MAQADDGDDEGARTPDARLTEQLRAGTSTAYAALQELRRRHGPSALAYARLCTASELSARQLSAQVLTTAARETARGVEPQVPLRHQLLLLTARLAESWARDERSAGLDPGLLLVLNTGPTPPMLAAFRTLTSRTQGLVWYGIVEGEREDRTAAYLGLSPEDVLYDTPHALQSMAKACLRSRLNASDDPRCADFRRLIEEAVRPDTPRYSADLHAHMARCAHCTAAHEDLTALRDAPRETLAEGLLPWAGTPYVRNDEEPPTRLNAHSLHQGRRPSRRVLLTSAALGVALTPLLVLLLSPTGSPEQRSAAATVPPTTPPVTVTTTTTVSASPSPAKTKSPSPKASPSHQKPPSPKPKPKPKPTPTPSPPPAQPPGSAYAQVVNVATGRCLDVRDGYFDNGVDVVTAPCTSSPTQRWRVDTYRGVLQNSADTDFCLDSRGSTDRGVGIWTCDSVWGSNGQNLRFTVDTDGVIRPNIDIGTAVTPSWGDGVSLESLSGGSEQRWRAGAG